MAQPHRQVCRLSRVLFGRSDIAVSTVTTEELAVHICVVEESVSVYSAGGVSFSQAASLVRMGHLICTTREPFEVVGRLPITSWNYAKNGLTTFLPRGALLLQQGTVYGSDRFLSLPTNVKSARKS